MIKISLEEFDLIIKQYKNGRSQFDTDGVYIITLDNCNGITTNLLETYETLPIDIKFKIAGDLYGYEDSQKKDYNYSLDEMKKIISIFEEIGKDMPQDLTEVERFLYIYRTLGECIEYKEIIPADFNELFESNGIQRSLYSTLLNGDGVCVGYALTLEKVLNYYNINCVQVSGMGHIENGISGKHAWNAVEIDGKWYFTDLTWDANNISELPYCLMVSEGFTKSHELENDCIPGTLAEADYNYEELLQKMEICYNKFDLKSVVERVQSYRLEKKKIKTIEDMSFQELAEAVLGEDFLKTINPTDAVKIALETTTTESANKARNVEKRELDKTRE